MDTSYINQTEKDMSGQPVDRLKLLYPNVDEKLTPLPRSWSSQEKCTSIGLTQNNLRVHYKGFYKQIHFYLASKLHYSCGVRCVLRFKLVIVCRMWCDVPHFANNQHKNFPFRR